MCSRAQSGPNSLATACSTWMAASRMLYTGSCGTGKQYMTAVRGGESGMQPRSTFSGGYAGDAQVRLAD
jgi:hypothetical protein